MELVIQSLKHNFVVALLEEKEYEENTFNFIKDLLKKYKKICYILLQSSYAEIKEEFSKNNIPLVKIHFIDILSKHYENPKKTKNCTFLDGPSIPDLLIGIANAIKKEKCEIVLFDNISTLLSYHSSADIENFTNTLKTNKGYNKTKKLYLMQKKDKVIQKEIDKFICDLRLFADKIVELN
ncbi:hypothetical protein JXB41_03780 [Candidatus Woesearchaeota archaeon]|nr:hypothetical protein [Candidatus Woesearchaeota archaeon]